MKKFYVPKGETINLAELHTEIVIVNGTLKVAGKLTAKHLQGHGYVEAEEILCDTSSVDTMRAQVATAQKIIAKKLLVRDCRAEEIVVTDFLEALQVQAHRLSMTSARLERCDADETITLPQKKRGMLGMLFASWWRSLLLPSNLPTKATKTQAAKAKQPVKAEIAPEPKSEPAISYGGTEYKNFPLPRLVFKFEHQQGSRIMRSWMGVVGEGFLTPKAPMYHYPFSNVSGRYHLCTGSNPLPVCKSLHTLGSIPYCILEMPNNNDHFSKNHNKLKLEMRDLMELPRDKDPDNYYSDILIPDKNTLLDFINAN